MVFLIVSILRDWLGIDSDRAELSMLANDVQSAVLPLLRPDQRFPLIDRDVLAKVVQPDFAITDRTVEYVRDRTGFLSRWGFRRRGGGAIGPPAEKAQIGCFWRDFTR